MEVSKPDPYNEHLNKTKEEKNENQGLSTNTR
jgi:hypothetical protein